MTLANNDPPQRRSFWTIERRDAAAGYIFIAPQLIGICIFVLIPLGLVFWYSLHEWNVLASTFRFVGAENYQTLLNDKSLPQVLLASAIFSVGLVILNMTLALLLAVAVSVDVAALAAASAVLLGAYNRWLKGLPLVGNVAVAAVIAAAPLLGALAVEAVPPAVVAAVTLTFGIALAREMTKDVEDTVGDAAAGARTLPVVWGEGRAAWAAVVVIGATVAGLPLAVALGVERSFLAYVVGAALCLLAAAWVLAVGTVARGSVLRRSATRARQWLKAGMVAGVIALLATALG